MHSFDMALHALLGPAFPVANVAFEPETNVVQFDVHFQRAHIGVCKVAFGTFHRLALDGVPLSKLGVLDLDLNITGYFYTTL